MIQLDGEEAILPHVSHNFDADILGTVSKMSLKASDHFRVNPSAPVSSFRAKGAPTGSLARGYYGQHLGLTNHTKDDVLINQRKGKVSDNLATVR